MVLFKSKWSYLYYVVDFEWFGGFSAVMGWKRYVSMHFKQDHNSTTEEENEGN